MAATQAEYERARFHLIIGIFSFVGRRHDSPLCPSYSTWAYGRDRSDSKNYTKYGGEGGEWERLSRIQRTATCGECFPDWGAANYSPGIPQLDPDEPELWWDIKESDVTEECVRTTGYVDDSYLDGWQEQVRDLRADQTFNGWDRVNGCLKLCPFKLPEVEDVEACRLAEGRHNKFNLSCLTNNEHCPNCNLLVQVQCVQCSAVRAVRAVRAIQCSAVLSACSALLSAYSDSPLQSLTPPTPFPLPPAILGADASRVLWRAQESRAGDGGEASRTHRTSHRSQVT
jgi:hypothetical protein